MIRAWSARNLRRPFARQRESATAAAASVVTQKKMRASLRPLLGQMSLGMPEHRHERQVRQEARGVRFAGRVVLDRVVQVDDLLVRVLPLHEVLAADLDRRSFGLHVRTGHAVEAPQDLHPERDGERAGEHADGDADAGGPGPAVLHRRQPLSGLSAAGAPEEQREAGRGHGAERERGQRHASPHLVEPVGRRVDGHEREECADGVEQGVAVHR